MMTGPDPPGSRAGSSRFVYQNCDRCSLIASCHGYLGVFGVVGLAYRRLTSADHQLRLDSLDQC